MVTYLIIYYIINVVLGIGYTVYTAFDGPVLQDTGTYVVATILSAVNLALVIIFLL